MFFNNARLTRSVLKPKYSATNRPMSCVFLPWLLASPGHQHQWHWLCSVIRPLSSARSAWKWKYILMLPKIYSTHHGMIMNPHLTSPDPECSFHMLSYCLVVDVLTHQWTYYMRPQAGALKYFSRQVIWNSQCLGLKYSLHICFTFQQGKPFCYCWEYHILLYHSFLISMFNYFTR